MLMPMKKLLPLVQCCTPLAGSSISDTEAAELERLFKALADRNRLKILNVLLRAGGTPVCVCEFQPALGISQPTVSHHLKQLTDAGLLLREKRGTFAYFRLTPGALDRISSLLAEQPALTNVA
jgi:ArsR family transcriptional regulator